MKIFGICGSIRKGSSNWQLLEICAQIGHEWTFFDLSRLPYFDPVLQFDKTPEIVKDFRKSAGTADLIFISTPEYAHGIPGILKNGLEWLFSEETMKKNVAVIIGSAQGEHVKDHLHEVLKTMDFNIQNEHFFLMSGLRSRLDAHGNLDEKTNNALEIFLKKVTDETRSNIT